MTALAMSDIIVSDESNVMAEALMFGKLSIAVADWLIPDCTPSRYANPMDYVIKTTKKDLRKDVKYKSIFPNIRGISRVFHNFVEKSDGSLLYKLGIREKYDIEIAFIEGRATKIIGASTNPNSKKIAWVHIDLSQGHWTSRVFRESYKEKKSAIKSLMI